MSGFLLDTNIPSELIRSRPDPRVEKWVYAQDEQSLYLSVVTIGELRRGLVILPASKRRSELERWLENDLLPRFEERILPVTRSIADRWGILDGQCQLKGTPLNTADGLNLPNDLVSSQVLAVELNTLEHDNGLYQILDAEVFGGVSDGLVGATVFTTLGAVTCPATPALQ